VAADNGSQQDEAAGDGVDARGKWYECPPHVQRHVHFTPPSLGWCKTSRAKGSTTLPLQPHQPLTQSWMWRHTRVGTICM
jgi:hypothetical protein